MERASRGKDLMSLQDSRVQSHLDSESQKPLKSSPVTRQDQQQPPQLNPSQCCLKWIQTHIFINGQMWEGPQLFHSLFFSLVRQTFPFCCSYLWHACSVTQSWLFATPWTVGFSVHGIYQARILEWLAISWSNLHLPVSCLGGGILYHWATRKAPTPLLLLLKFWS